MLESLFNNLTLAMSGTFSLALAASFSWGVLSILLSPCHLSSIPLIIGYISSRGLVEAKRSFILALLFSIGILLTITAIGFITAFMGRLMGDIGMLGNWLVAGIFVIIGLYLMDILRWDWNNLNVGKKQKNGLWGAFVLGLIFGIGLGPCTFAFLAPVLGAVFQIATDNLWKALLLISAFGLGHCTIIVAAGSATNIVQKYLDWTENSKSVIYMKRVSGFFVLLGGIYFIYSIYF
jgi:cytochrome c-type biogenesis protein